MKVSFEGIGENVVTFYNSSAGGVHSAGIPVKLTGNGEVSGCADGDRFFGVSIVCKEDFVSVQNAGYVETAYSGTAPEVGYARLLADGADGVKTGGSGGEFLVVGVDTANGTIGFML